MSSYSDRSESEADREPSGDDLVSPTFVCRNLGISRKTLYRMNCQNPPAIPYLRVGSKSGQIKYRWSAVKFYIDTHEIKRGSAHQRRKQVHPETSRKDRTNIERKKIIGRRFREQHPELFMSKNERRLHELCRIPALESIFSYANRRRLPCDR
jgi:hypothetical protein